jgi:hypothetical protein
LYNIFNTLIRFFASGLGVEMAPWQRSWQRNANFAGQLEPKKVPKLALLRGSVRPERVCHLALDRRPI